MRSAVFDIEEAEQAADRWGFNCGPAAICAVTGLTPEKVRPHLIDFESRGHMNPSMMLTAMTTMGLRPHLMWSCAADITEPPEDARYPDRLGVVRVQWAGRWTGEGVPVRVRYRHTHWIAVRGVDAFGWPQEVFDINAIGVGGWLSFGRWFRDLVPWLLQEAGAKWSGVWWPTHCYCICGDAVPCILR